MFVYYNVIWIICIVLLFLSLCMLYGRRRVRRQANITTAQYGNPEYVIVDMNGRQTYQPTRPATYAPPPPTQPTQADSTQQQFYRPPEQNPVEPPPPSYQDYSKDYRVQHLQ